MNRPTDRLTQTDAVMHMYLHVNMQACILAHMGDIPADVMDLVMHFHGYIIIIHSFYIVLFSALEQTHYAH